MYENTVYFGIFCYAFGYPSTLEYEQKHHLTLSLLTYFSKYVIKIAQISSTHLIYEDAKFKDIRQRLGIKGKHTSSPTQNIREKVGHDEQKQEKQAIPTSVIVPVGRYVINRASVRACMPVGRTNTI